MKKEYIVFGAPDIQGDEIEEIIDSLKSGWLGTGPKVAKFESDFSLHSNSKHSIAVNSCTAALHLSLVALGLGPGDEVITTPMTFAATVNAIIHAGATPVLADINPKTYNIDPAQIKKAITDKTKAVLPVHFAGLPCEMDRIMEIAGDFNLYVVEDCAHAVEAKIGNKCVGTYGDFGCFSFYVTKNVVTGEGGMITTNNKDYADLVKTLSLHGLSSDAWDRFSDKGFKKYEVVSCGYKYNMMDLQAALGIHQLRRVDSNWKRRKAIWNYYNDKFSDLPIELPPSGSNTNKHSFHLYTILVDNKKGKQSRDQLMRNLHDDGVGTGIHYLSIPEHAYYRRTFGWNPEDYKYAYDVSKRTLSLPLSPNLTDEKVDRVVQSVRKQFGKT